MTVMLWCDKLAADMHISALATEIAVSASPVMWAGRTRQADTTLIGGCWLEPDRLAQT